MSQSPEAKVFLASHVLQVFNQLIAGMTTQMFYQHLFTRLNFFQIRFDYDLIDKYGNAQIDNEFYVNKNILRPTRRTRDNIEILSSLYRDPPKRYSGEFRDKYYLPSYNKSTKAQYLCLHYELGF